MYSTASSILVIKVDFFFRSEILMGTKTSPFLYPFYKIRQFEVTVLKNHGSNKQTGTRFYRSSTLTESLALPTVDLNQKSRIPHCYLTWIDSKIA